MSVEATVVEQPSTMPVAKTLPMKFKAMHYAVVAFVSSQSNMDEEQKKTLLESLPIHKSVQEQLEFYESLVNFKKVETEIIKPMQKQRKLQEKQEKKVAEKALKEKKPRAPRKKKEPLESVQVPASITETIAEENGPSEKNVTQASTENNAQPPTIKKPKVSKKSSEKKNVKEKRTTQENKTEPLQETPQNFVMEIADEMKEEAYISNVKSTEKDAEKPKKKRVAKKKEPKKDVVADEKEKEDHYLFIRDGSRYWTNDEMFQNGSVFEDIVNEEGDSDSGKLIGSLVNGGLCLNK